MTEPLNKDDPRVQLAAYVLLVASVKATEGKPEFADIHELFKAGLERFDLPKIIEAYESCH